MMKKLCIAILFLFAFGAYAQNLVLNPSFETTTGCVGFTGGLNNWDDANSGADSCESPDLFATCFPSGLPTSVPNNWLGSQAPHTGNRYAGIITYSPGLAFNCNPLGSDQYREYIEGQLSSPLVAGQTYCVSFWVNLAGKVTWSTNQMSVYFSNTLLQHDFCASPGVMPVTPQLNYSGAVLSDTTNWVQLTWNYVATGGEQYFTIGNFKNNSNTTHANNNCNSMNYFAYYYIDDVSIIAGACQSCALSASIPSHTNVSCNGGNNGSATVSLTGGSGSATYSWVPAGGNSATANNLSAGVYTVNVTDGSCTSSATVNITQPSALTVATTSIVSATCGQSNGSATAIGTGGTGALTYSWSTGATGTTLSNVIGGTYTVTMTDANGCTAMATATIGNASGPSASSTVTQSVTCSGGSNGAANVTITGGTPAYSVSWSNGASGVNISNVPKGVYSYTVTDANGCTTSGNINIPGAPDMLTNFSTNCGPGSGSATVTVSGGTPGYTYSWAPGGMTGNVQAGLANGNYTCTVTDANNCVRYVQLVINCGSTGITSYMGQNALVYPNPADGVVIVRSERTPLSINLYSVQGELLAKEVPVGFETSIDLTKFSQGIYFIRVEFENNDVYYTRVLRQ